LHAEILVIGRVNAVIQSCKSVLNIAAWHYIRIKVLNADLEDHFPDINCSERIYQNITLKTIIYAEIIIAVVHNISTTA